MTVKNVRRILAVALLSLGTVLAVHAPQAHADINAGPPSVIGVADNGTFGLVYLEGHGLLWGSTPTVTFSQPDGTVLATQKVYVAPIKGTFSLRIQLHLVDPCVRTVDVSTYDTGPTATIDLGDPAVVAENQARLAATHLAQITYTNNVPLIEQAYQQFQAAYAVYSAAVAQDAACTR